MKDKWQKRFDRLRLFGELALVGLPFLLAAYLSSDFARTFCGVAAAMLIVPGFVYVYVIVIWHWKHRYRGNHSDLWGALILIETSGWMKLVCIFRHIVPDMYHTGRYRLESPQLVS
jgi:hypothetical protein